MEFDERKKHLLSEMLKLRHWTNCCEEAEKTHPTILHDGRITEEDKRAREYRTELWGQTYKPRYINECNQHGLPVL
ncbi:hypothetical protein COV15_00945 [Candidatus Woesearchaeota archaeon CG10_big_fil_rev_8_21_14_0_10_34_12]|nr:MAG: hypothetical protein COV15_00945 [Candidatus Woesearchaeota archaeon CG10_big_fil_rev_8_21_14_0_10_34_12]